MNLKIVFGVIFLLAGIFQTITVWLLARGNDHYILKYFRRGIAMVFYGIFALVLLVLGFRTLLVP